MSVEQQETSSAGVSSSPFSTDFNSLGSRGRMLILFGALQPMSRRPRTLFCGTGTAKRLPVPSEPSRKTWCNEWKVFFCQFWGAQTVVFFYRGRFCLATRLVSSVAVDNRIDIGVHRWTRRTRSVRSSVSSPAAADWRT